MGQYGFDRACFSVVFLFLLCFIDHLYEASGGPDMEVLACFRPVFFVAVEFNWECVTKIGGGPGRFFDVFLSIYSLWTFQKNGLHGCGIVCKCSNRFLLVFRRDEGAAYCFRFSRFFFYSGDIQPLMAALKFFIGF